MKTIEAKELLQKYQLGLCTEEENALVETWYLKHQVSDPVTLSEEERLADIYKIWDHLAAGLAKKHLVKSTRLWSRLAAAAAVVLVIGAGLYHYTQFSEHQQRELAMMNIPTGKNAAILTLANGKKINLTDAINGSIAADAGVSITKTADGQIVYSIKEDDGKKAVVDVVYNTISTPRGGQYQVNLPDGSLVWLNAASELKFPASFTGLQERKIELKGEAYFKVKHNDVQSFKVHTMGQVVEDLGTEFNINGYADENTIKTTLLEGSARVNNKILIPGQQAVFINAGNIKIQVADTQEAIAWKNGDFAFRNTDFRTVMRKIARWYNVDVSYDSSAPSDIPLGGLVSRSKNISVLLKLMEETGAVHFKVEGRKITVSK